MRPIANTRILQNRTTSAYLTKHISGFYKVNFRGVEATRPDYRNYRYRFVESGEKVCRNRNFTLQKPEKENLIHRKRVKKQ